MNKLPPSSDGSTIKATPEQDTGPDSAATTEPAKGDWQTKEVKATDQGRQQPLEEPMVEQVPLSEKVTVPDSPERSEEDEVKPRHPVKVIVDRTDVLSLDETQTVFGALEFPSMSHHQHLFGRVLTDLDKSILKRDKPRHLRAHAMFNKALLLRRMGRSEEEVSKSLQLAYKMDPAMTSSQVTLATAHSCLEVQQEMASYDDLFASMNRLRRADFETPCSFLSKLKVSQILMGRFTKPGLELCQSPYHLPRHFKLLSIMMTFPNVPEIEATFCNGLDLSFVLKQELYSLDDLTDDELGIAAILWLAQFSKDPYEGKYHPARWCRGMSARRYPQIAKVFFATAFDQKENIDELFNEAELKNLERSLAELADIELRPPVTFTKAFIAMILGRCIEIGVYDKPEKNCAEYYAYAARHKSFVSLLPMAAEHFQAALCYREASDLLVEYLERALFDDDWDRIVEQIEECNEQDRRQQLFLQQSGAVETEASDKATGGDSAPKPSGKNKRRKGGRNGSKKPALSQTGKKTKAVNRDSVKATQSLPQLQEDEPEVDSQVVAEEQQSIVQPSGATAVATSVHKTSVHNQWNNEAHEAMEQFHEARRRGRRQDEERHILRAAAKAQSSGEQYDIHYQAAWHYLRQVSLLPRFRTAKQDGRPASVEFLCKTGRRQLAKCFSSLTGVHVKATVTPDEMRAALGQCLPPKGMDTEAEAEYREQLRMIMSSFGHSFSYQADYAPENEALRYNTQEFYKLKKVAKPFYSKKTEPLASKMRGVHVISQEELQARKQLEQFDRY